MEERLLGRGKTSGRADDNADTIKKRCGSCWVWPLLQERKAHDEGMLHCMSHDTVTSSMPEHCVHHVAVAADAAKHITCSCHQPHIQSSF